MGGAGEGGGIHVTGCQTEIGFFSGGKAVQLASACFALFYCIHWGMFVK